MPHDDPFLPPDPEWNPYSPPKAALGRGRLATAKAPIGRTLGDVVSWTWEIYRKRMPALIGMVVACVAMQMLAILAMLAVVGAENEFLKHRNLTDPLAGIMVIAVLPFVVWLQVGLGLVLLDIARGKDVVFRRMFQGGRHVAKVLCLGFFLVIATYTLLLLGLVPGVIVFAMTGFNFVFLILFGGLCIVVSVVASTVVMVRVSQSFFLIVDRGAGFFESVRVSYRVTQENSRLVLGIALLSWLLNFAGNLAFFVGLFFTVPFTMLLFVATYLALTEQPKDDPSAGGAVFDELEIL